ncbi:MAG: methyltransferase domain-containing protein [Candidatus Omnitrophica bacterium]|nr:methyltransferase domain-containing protein [Candidatus Omnitrophota bacterium]
MFWHKMMHGLSVFLNPRSPAAIYRNPACFTFNISAQMLNLILKLNLLFNNRKKVKCLICGWEGNQFGYSAAISCNSFRKSQICFGCGSNGRSRFLIEILFKKTDFTNKDLTIVDVGAAPSTKKIFEKYPHIRYLTVDRFKESDITSDIEHSIRLSSQSVDIILCCHVLEHIDNYHQTLQEFSRILKDAGLGIIAVPQTPGLQKSKKLTNDSFHGYGHKWEFGNDFPEELRRTGFEVTTTTNPQGEPFHFIQKPFSATMAQ